MVKITLLIFPVTHDVRKIKIIEFTNKRERSYAIEYGLNCVVLHDTKQTLEVESSTKVGRLY